jgi:uncharacterized protein (TIGR02217 family)
MSVVILQERFPIIIAYGMLGGPRFVTQRVGTGGGFAYKNSQLSNPLREYQLDTANWKQEHYDILNAFILSVSFGQLNNFRLTDKLDYAATAQPIGIGNGTNLVFQLQKTYTSPSGNRTYVRKLTQIQGAFVGDPTPLIYVNGTLVSSSNYTLSLSTGVLTFGAGHAPPNTQPVTWTGQFDVPVEILSDYTPATYEDFGKINIKSLTMREVRVS